MSSFNLKITGYIEKFEKFEKEVRRTALNIQRRYVNAHAFQARREFPSIVKAEIPNAVTIFPAHPENRVQVVKAKTSGNASPVAFLRITDNGTFGRRDFLSRVLIQHEIGESVNIPARAIAFSRMFAGGKNGRRAKEFRRKVRHKDFIDTPLKFRVSPSAKQIKYANLFSALVEYRKKRDSVLYKLPDSDIIYELECESHWGHSFFENIRKLGRLLPATVKTITRKDLLLKSFNRVNPQAIMDDITNRI